MLFNIHQLVIPNLIIIKHNCYFFCLLVMVLKDGDAGWSFSEFVHPSVQSNIQYISLSTDQIVMKCDKNIHCLVVLWCHCQVKTFPWVTQAKTFFWFSWKFAVDIHGPQWMNPMFLVDPTDLSYSAIIRPKFSFEHDKY